MQRELRVPQSDTRVDKLLGHLPPDEWSLMGPHAQVVTLRFGPILFSDGEPADMVYFPLTAIVP